MECIDAIRSRGTVRSFEHRPVPRRLIEAIIADAATAPPPYSTDHQPLGWAFHVLEGAERVAALGVRAKQYVRDRGLGVAGLIERDEYKLFWDAPAVIVIFGSEEDCGRAGMLLLLSAHARGLGGCWVGSPMPWLCDPDTRVELGFPTKPGAAICVGYGSYKATPRPRQEVAIAWS